MDILIRNISHADMVGLDKYFDVTEIPEHCFNCSSKVDPDNRRCDVDGHVFEETFSKLTCSRDDKCPWSVVLGHG